MSKTSKKHIFGKNCPQMAFFGSNGKVKLFLELKNTHFIFSTSSQNFASNKSYGQIKVQILLKTPKTHSKLHFLAMTHK